MSLDVTLGGNPLICVRDTISTDIRELRIVKTPVSNDLPTGRTDPKLVSAARIPALFGNIASLNVNVLSLEVLLQRTDSFIAENSLSD